MRTVVDHKIHDDADIALMRLARQVLRSIAGDGHVEPRPQHQQKVAILQRKICASRRHVARTPDERRNIGRHQIGRAPGRYRGHIQQQAQLAELFLRAGQTGTVPGKQQRPR